MLHRYFGENIHNQLQTFGLSVLAIGIPLSKVVMSSAMLFLALNFLLQGNYKSKVKKLKQSKSFWWVFAFALLHVVALLWSENMSYALHDLRVKAPLIVIVVILLAQPVKILRHLHIILYCFVASTLITSIINFGIYHQVIGNYIPNDIRGLSFFGSHVRYGIIVSMSVGILIYFIRKKGFHWLYLIAIVWLIFYTFYSQVLSGLLALIGIVFFYAIFLVWKKQRVVAVVISACCFVIGAWSLIWTFKPMSIDPSEYKNLDTVTKEGNPYEHHFDVITVETGEPTNIYVCTNELEREWPKYSSLDINGFDLKGQPLKKTVIRYLSTKKLRKDAHGLSQLTKKEIKEIEKGNASVTKAGLMARVYGIKHQITNSKFPNNHSLLERIEYWKAGWSIFKKNFIIGVGTGDVQDAFNEEYILQKTLLEVENRHRSHNMFLTVGVTFGVVGLIAFVGLLLHFFILNYKNRQLVGVFFIIIAIISFIPEDTLETQTGVTFFALFYGLFGTIISPEGKS